MELSERCHRPGHRPVLWWHDPPYRIVLTAAITAGITGALITGDGYAWLLTTAAVAAAVSYPLRARIRHLATGIQQQDRSVFRLGCSWQLLQLSLLLTVLFGCLWLLIGSLLAAAGVPATWLSAAPAAAVVGVVARSSWQTGRPPPEARWQRIGGLEISHDGQLVSIRGVHPETAAVQISHEDWVDFLTRIRGGAGPHAPQAATEP